jgi:hypothetical protein
MQQNKEVQSYDAVDRNCDLQSLQVDAPLAHGCDGVGVKYAVDKSDLRETVRAALKKLLDKRIPDDRR